MILILGMVLPIQVQEHILGLVLILRDVIVQFILNLTLITSTSTSTVACDTYTWNGTTYTSLGTYTWVGTNMSGCDILLTLNLTLITSTSTSQYM